MAIKVQGMDCYRNLHLVYCCVLLVTGVICVYAGVTLNNIYSEYELFLPASLSALVVMLFFAGGFNFFAIFLCFWSAWRKTTWLVFCLSLLLGTVLSIELASGTTGFIFHSYKNELITKKMHKQLDGYNPRNKEITYAWDVIQMQCCGVYNYQDWLLKMNGLPISCCPMWPGILNETRCDQSSPLLHQVGCLERFSVFITENTNNVGKMGVFAAVLQFIGFSCVLVIYHIFDYMASREREREKLLSNERMGVFSI